MDETEDNIVFVTGGSGFLGRQVIQDLIESGYQIRALSRSTRAAETVRELGAEAVMGDLHNVLAMEAGMSACCAVIHCAAKVDLWGDWEEFQRGTVEGTMHVVSAARMAKVPRLIHISTEAVLAGGQEIVNADETTPYPKFPDGPYPRSKAMAERYVLAANGEGLETIVVRPRMIWGRGDTSLLPELIDTASNGWIWFGGGNHRISTCNVRNASRGVLDALEKGRPGQIYFITDGPPVVFRDFITRLLATQGIDPGGRKLPLWTLLLLAKVLEFAWDKFQLEGKPAVTSTSANLFFREVTVSDSKARQELGYRPVISIEDGMQEIGQYTN